MTTPAVHDFDVVRSYVATPGQTTFTMPCKLYAGYESAFVVAVAGALLVYNSVPIAGQFKAVATGEEGCNIVLGAACVGGEIVNISRGLPIERVVEFLETGPVPMTSVNLDLNRIMSVIQDVAGRFRRTLMVGVGEVITTLPAAAARANKWLRFNNAGDPELVDAPVGSPGGNVMATGLFTALALLSVPVGTDLIHTSGHSVQGRGAADYILDATLADADVAANPKTIVKTANGRFFRLAPDQIWHVAMFGTIGDGLIANAATNIAALEGLKSYGLKYKRTGVGYGTAGHSIWWGYNDVHIGANTFDLTDYEIAIFGETGGGTAAGASIIRSSGTAAVRIQNADTTGATATRAVTLAQGSGTHIVGLAAVGDGTGAGEVHGFHARGNCQLIGCVAYGFAGNGFNVVASSGAPYKGNANCTLLQGCLAQGNLNGFVFSGDDANACTVIHCNAIANKQWGFDDEAFVGSNTYIGCHTAANGWDGALGSIATASTYGGHRYFIKPGMAALAIVNAPSGTTADTAYWGHIGAGGTYNGVATWDGVTVFREGGSYKSNNPSAVNRYISCYAEGDQNPPQILAPSACEGGIVAVVNRGSGANHHTDTGGTMQVSPGLALENRTDSQGSTLYWNSRVAGVLNFDGRIDNLTLAGLRYFATSYHEFHITGAGAGRVAYMSSGGLFFEAGKQVFINGNKVLDSRGVKGAAGLAEVVACLDHHGLWD